MPFQDDLSSKDVFNALKQSVLLHFGDVGWGEVGASLAGKQSPCSFFFLFLLPMFSFSLTLKCFLFCNFGGWVVETVKYFSPVTNLCIVRVARGTAANTTWAALVLIDRVGASGGGQGRKVVPHVIHVSGTSPTSTPLSLSLLGLSLECGFCRARHSQARADCGGRME